MPAYTRDDIIVAIQFNEEAFHKEPLNFPMVFDKAMTNKKWMKKKAEDGRYYINQQTNTHPFHHSFDVAEGDYIVTESGGWCYTVPKEIFEMLHKKIG